MERYPAIYVPATDLFASLPRSSYDRFVVGRDASANLCVADDAWAPEQFSIRVEYRGTVLEPLSEATPTLINGSPIEKSRVLQHGDTISAGSSSVVYLEKADPRLRKPPVAAPPPAPAAELPPL